MPIAVISLLAGVALVLGTFGDAASVEVARLNVSARLIGRRVMRPATRLMTP